MFCPKCKAEYRVGFTRCEDCNADLVESLGAPGNRTPGDDLSVPVLLWSGFHTGTLEDIRAALDDADIPYNDETLEARLLYASMRNPLEVWVQKSDFDAAKKLVSKRLAGDGGSEAALTGLQIEANEPAIVGAQRSSSADESIPTNADSASGTDSAGDDDPEPDPESELPEQPYDPTEEIEEPAPPRNLHGDVEEQPTCEVWSGKENDIVDYLAMCFREDSIRFAQLPDGSGGVRILVYPDREERARLIVREVVEGQSPE
jgi:hypothetical protein